ncbi:MAG: hypothetical protein ACRC6O_04530 [Flavobacterium sp.]
MSSVGTTHFVATDFNPLAVGPTHFVAMEFIPLKKRINYTASASVSLVPTNKG